MKVLIVDDQKLIADNLKTGVNWDLLQVEEVYTAYSAMEAKLMLVNFPIDLMISDIEMPGEDGLELFQWAKEKFADLECIFLTSHADFEYAQKAVQLGGFDYILQPARYSDVEEAVIKVSKRITESRKRKQIKESQKLVMKQRDLLLHGMIQRLQDERMEEAELIWRHLKEIFLLEYRQFVCYPVLVQITKGNKWDWQRQGDLLEFMIHNIFQELIGEWQGMLCMAREQESGYLLLAVGEADQLTEDKWTEIVRSFYTFTANRMQVGITVYPGNVLLEHPLRRLKAELIDRYGDWTKQEPGIVWEISKTASNSSENDETLRIQKAIQYIQTNLNKNISRTDIAGVVFLNEDYFSRLFKLETGYTYKEYVLMEKMKLAKKLLVQTKLSISIIASKVGYDNFSHFSKMFKKLEDKTPQEYRKDNQKEL